jgi:hypothetical protein
MVITMINSKYKIVEFRGREFKVFDNGEIWSPLFIQKNGKILWPKRKSESTKMKNGKNLGYKSVGFRSNGKVERVSVHRLVAMAFLDDWDESLTVDHIDGDKSNNAASNLRMVSSCMNTRLYHFNNGERFGFSCFNVVSYGERFRASMRFNGVTLHSPLFETRIEAAQAVNGLCIKHNMPIQRFNTPLKAI